MIRAIGTVAAGVACVLLLAALVLILPMLRYSGGIVPTLQSVAVVTALGLGWLGTFVAYCTLRRLR